MKITSIFTVLVSSALLQPCALPAIAGTTISEPFPMLTGTLGVPDAFSYVPPFYTVEDPTGTFLFGIQPYLTFGGELLNIQCSGTANLTVNQNGGWNNYFFLSDGPGFATITLGSTIGINIEIGAFDNILDGSLNLTNLPNGGQWGFSASNSLNNFLLDSSNQLTATISPTLFSVNTLDALTLLFGIDLPDWLASINLGATADITLNQVLSGEIASSAGEFLSDGQQIPVVVNGGSYEVDNLTETWNDQISESLGLGANLSVGLLDGLVSFQLLNAENLIPITSLSQSAQVHSATVSPLVFNLSSIEVSASSGPNGNISPTGQVAVSYGQTAYFSAVCSNDYAVNTWAVDGTVTQYGGLNFALTNVTSPQSVYVTFSALASGVSFGSVTVNSITANSAALYSSIYPHGEAITLSVIGGPINGNTNVVYASGGYISAGATNKVGLGPYDISLNAGTSYVMRFEAQTSSGNVFSQVVMFETPPAGSLPAVESEGVSSISASGAIFNAVVDPSLQTTAVWWNISYDHTNILSPSLSLPAIATAVGIGPWTATLPPATLVSWTIVASNLWGVALSPPQTFLTLPLAPTAENTIVTNLTPTVALVTSTINANSGAAYCSVTATNLTSGSVTNTPFTYIGSGSSPTVATMTLTGLSWSTAYSGCVIVTNGGGMGLQMFQFTTPAMSRPTIFITPLPDGMVGVGVTNASETPLIQWSSDGYRWLNLTNAAYAVDSPTNPYRLYRAVIQAQN